MARLYDMPSKAQWNRLIAATLLLGCMWIALTRAEVGVIRSVMQSVVISPPADAPPAARVGARAPTFTLTTTDGRSVALEDLRGMVVLVNIWATWCPPCRAEMPAMQASYAHYRDQGFVVLAINQREDLATVHSFVKDRGLAFPILLDTDGRVGAAYQASALPSSFFIGRDGTVRVVYRGPLPRGVIDATVEGLLGEDR